MNILICGGKTEADYVLSAFHNKKNNIVVLNDDEDTCDILSEHYGIEVLKFDPTKIYAFRDAKVEGFDLVISLMNSDAENFVVCKMAKSMFHIKKAICTISDPNNVSVFKQLGIDVPLSSSYLLTQSIKGESDVESIIKTYSFENNKLAIYEVKILPEFWCVGTALKDLHLPECGNITCIFRDPDVVIPRGNTVIEANDNLFIASAPENQEFLCNYIKEPAKDEE